MPRGIDVWFVSIKFILAPKWSSEFVTDGVQRAHSEQMEQTASATHVACQSLPKYAKKEGTKFGTFSLLTS